MLTNAVDPHNAASILMLKKALEMQEQLAAQLIASVAESAPHPVGGASLGGNIDVYA
jgi:hypothetical protein